MLTFKFFFLCLFTFACIANATDQELAIKLKNELEFDTQRRNDFKSQRKNNDVYEKEREKGLSLFLEEQEKWDVTRDKGLKAQRAERLKEKKMDEGSPEYVQDLKEKKKYEQEQIAARKKHIETRDMIVQSFKNKAQVSEEEELEVYNQRPRYTLRQRAQNKWVSRGAGGRMGGGSSPGFSGSGGSIPSPGNSAFDYPTNPNPEYIPTDNFEEIPPPPPMPYEGSYPPPGGDYYNGGGNFNGNPDYGAPPMGYPPPPPPEGGWDF